MPNWNDSASVVAWVKEQQEKKKQEQEEAQRAEQKARRERIDAQNAADRARQAQKQADIHAAALKNKTQYGPQSREDTPSRFSGWRDVRTPDKREEDERNAQEDRKKRNEERRQAEARALAAERFSTRDDIPTSRVWNKDRRAEANEMSRVDNTPRYSGIDLEERAQAQRDNRDMNRQTSAYAEREDANAQEQRNRVQATDEATYGQAWRRDEVQQKQWDEEAQQRKAEQAVEDYRAAERRSQETPYQQPNTGLPQNIAPELAEAQQFSADQRAAQQAREDVKQAAELNYRPTSGGYSPNQAVDPEGGPSGAYLGISPSMQESIAAANVAQDAIEAARPEGAGDAWVQRQNDERRANNAERWADFEADKPDTTGMSVPGKVITNALRGVNYAGNQIAAAAGGVMQGFEYAFKPTYNAYTTPLPGSAETLAWQKEAERLAQDKTPEGQAAYAEHQRNKPNLFRGELGPDDISAMQFFAPALGALNLAFNPFNPNRINYDDLDYRTDTTTLKDRGQTIVEINGEEHIVDNGTWEALQMTLLTPAAMRFISVMKNTEQAKEFMDTHVQAEQESMSMLNEWVDHLPQDVQDYLRAGQVNQVGNSHSQWQTAIDLTQKFDIAGLQAQADALYAQGHIDAADFLNKRAKQLAEQSYTDTVYANQEPMPMLVTQLAIDPLNIFDAIGVAVAGVKAVRTVNRLANAVDSADAVIDVARASNAAEMLAPTGKVLGIAGTRKRANNILNIVAKTPNSIASADRAVTMGWFAGLLAQVKNTEDARIIVDAAINTPHVLLEEGIEGLTSPFFVKMAQDGLKPTWGASATANESIIKRFGVIKAAAADIMKSPSLTPGATWNPVAVIADLDNALFKAAQQAQGIVLKADIPYGAADFKVVSSGKAAHVNFIDKKGNVLKTLNFQNEAKATEFATELRNSINAGKGDVLDKMMHAGRIPDTVARSVMSDMWLNLRPGHWVRNALNAVTTLQTDGLMTFMKMQDIDMGIAYKSLAGGVNPRIFEAVNNTGRSVGAAVEAFGDQPHWSRKLLAKNNPVAAVVEAGSKIWSGPTEIGQRIPVGEQAFVKRGWYKQFSASFDKAWGEAVAKGAIKPPPGSASEIMGRPTADFATFLKDEGIPADLAKRIVDTVTQVGRSKGKEEVYDAVKAMLAAPTITPSINDLNLPTDLISNTGIQRLDQTLKLWFNGKNVTTTGVDELKKGIDSILDYEAKTIGDIANAAPPQPGVYVWQAQEALQESAALMDDMTDAAKRLGIPPDEAKKAASEAGAAYHEIEQQAQQALVDAVKAESPEKGVSYAVDAWNRIYEARAATRKEIDALGEAAASGNKWEDFYRQRPELNKKLAETIQGIVNDTKKAMQDGTPPKTSNAQNLIDRVAKYDEDVIRHAAEVPTGSTVAQQEVFKRSLEANRTIIDALEASMYRAAQAYPSTEAIDIMFAATQKAQLMGAQVNAYLTPLRNDAMAGLLDWQKYYEIRNEGWQQYYSAVQANTTASLRSIIEHSLALTAENANDAINIVANARDIADELTAQVTQMIARQGDDYGRAASAARSGSGDVSPAISGRNWNPFARKSSVQGTPNAARPPATGLQEHITRIATENQWPEQFTTELKQQLATLPEPVQAWLASNTQNYKIQRYSTVADAPTDLQAALKNAAGFVVRYPDQAPIMVFGPNQRLDPTTLAHETIHLAWTDLTNTQNAATRAAIKEHVNDTVAAAQKAVQNIKAAAAQNTNLNSLVDIQRRDVADVLKSITDNAAFSTAESLEAAMHYDLAYSTWDDLLEAEGLPTGQAGIISLWQAIADDAGVVLSPTYRVEEVIAYHAGSDPALIEKLFNGLQSYGVANKNPAADMDILKQVGRTVQPYTDAELENIGFAKHQAGGEIFYADDAAPNVEYTIRETDTGYALSKETTVISGDSVDRIVTQQLGEYPDLRTAERDMIFEAESGEPLPTVASDTVTIIDMPQIKRDIDSMAEAAPTPVNGNSIYKAAADAGIPTAYTNKANKTVPTDKHLLNIAKQQGADIAGKKKVSQLTPKEQEALLDELKRRAATGATPALSEAPPVPAAVKESNLDEAAQSLQNELDNNLDLQRSLNEAGTPDPKLDKKIKAQKKQIQSITQSSAELRKGYVLKPESPKHIAELEKQIDRAQKVIDNLKARASGSTRPSAELQNNIARAEQQLEVLKRQLNRLGDPNEIPLNPDPERIATWKAKKAAEQQAANDARQAYSELNHLLESQTPLPDGAQIEDYAQNNPQLMELWEEARFYEQKHADLQRELDEFRWTDEPKEPKALTANELLGLEPDENTEETITDIMRSTSGQPKAMEIGDTAASGSRALENTRAQLHKAADNSQNAAPTPASAGGAGGAGGAGTPPTPPAGAADNTPAPGRPIEDFTPVPEGADITEPLPSAQPAPSAPAPSAPAQPQRYKQLDDGRWVDTETGEILSGSPPDLQTLDPYSPSSARTLTPEQQARFAAAPIEAQAAIQNMLATIKNTTTPFQQRQIMAYVAKMLNQYDNIVYGASVVADHAVDFAMLNYKNRRNFDNILATMIPYHYFWTRSAVNWARRAAEKPAAIGHYLDVQRAIATENQQSGIPNRMKGTIPLWTRADGTQMRMANMTDFMFPFANYKGNDFYNENENTGNTEQLWLKSQKYGPGFFPYIQYAAAYALDKTDPLPNGELRTDQFYLGGIVPQLRLIESGYRAITGQDTRAGDQLNDPYVPYVDRRNASLDAVPMNNVPGKDPVQAQMAQQISTNLEAGQPRYTHIPQEQHAAADAAYAAAVKQTGAEKLLAQASYVTGVGMYAYRPEEAIAKQTQSNYYNAAASSYNPYGSEAAQQQVLDTNPWLAPFQTKAGDPGADQGQPAIQAQRTQQYQYRSSLIAKSQQEVQQAIKDAIAANPAIGVAEMATISAAIKAKYQADIDAASANIDALDQQATNDRYKYAGDNMPTPPTIRPDMPNPQDPAVATGEVGVDVPTINQHTLTAPGGPAPTAPVTPETLANTGAPPPTVQIGDPRAIGNPNALGALPAATPTAPAAPAAPVAPPTTPAAPPIATPTLIEAAAAAGIAVPDWRGMSEDEKQQAYNEWVFKVSNKLAGRPDEASKPVKPAADAPEAEWDAYNAAYKEYNTAYDAHNDQQEQFIIENLTNPTTITGLNPMTDSEALKFWEQYRQQNMSPEEIARRQELEVIGEQRAELQDFYNNDDMAGAEAYLLSHPELAAQLRAEKKAEGEELWIDKPPGKGAANIAAVNEKYGPEAGAAVEEYLALPAGAARQEYAAAHPEIKAYNLYAFNPEAAAQAEELFGEGIIEEWANTPPGSDDPEAMEARKQYLADHPVVWLADAWLTGRPEPYDPEQPKEDKATPGADWAQAEELFGSDIWDKVFSYKTGDRSEEVKQAYYAFSDWWNAAYPDDGKQWAEGTGGTQEARVANGDLVVLGEHQNADPRTPQEGGPEYDPGNGRYPPNAYYISSDGLVAYDRFGRRIDGVGNTGPTSYGNGGGGGYGRGGGGGGEGGGGYSSARSGTQEAPQIRSWRGDNPWYSGSWLNAGKALGPRR